MRSLLLTLIPFLAVGCAAEASDNAQSSEAAVEVHGLALWAGSTSVTIARYVADPCDNGKSRLDNTPISYDSWARQRAGIRNVCFEVWKPGVTDTDNTDYWRLLDVQVHYKFKGTDDWKMAYVPSLDRRGNNRRYAWSLDYQLDPNAGYNVGDTRAPFEITRESETSADILSELEFYFTVNGEKLSTSTNENFKVDYFGQVAKHALRPLPNGATKGVLYPSVKCTGATGGDGAGYEAVDITDQAAIDALLGSSDSIHAASMMLTGTGPDRVLTLMFSGGRNVGANELPAYVDGWGGPMSSVHAETKDLGAGKWSVEIKAYNRETKQLESRTAEFSGCAKQ